MANSPDYTAVLPVFGGLFTDEPVPVKGYLDVSTFNKPGFGSTLNPKIELIDADFLLSSSPEKPLKLANDCSNGHSNGYTNRKINDKAN